MKIIPSFLMALLGGLVLSAGAHAAVSLHKFDVYFGDINGDGISDYYMHRKLFVPIGVGASFPLPLFRDRYAFLGKPDGSYEDLVEWSQVVDVAAMPSVLLQLADFNGDGYQDFFIHSADAALNSLLVYTDGSGLYIASQFTHISNLQISGNSSVVVSDLYGSSLPGLIIDGQYVAETAGGESFAHVQDLYIDNGATGELYAQALPASLVGESGALASVSVAGQLGYAYPIQVPPGVAGFAPAVSLSYQSGGSGGIAGSGWSLSATMSVERCGRAPAFGDSAFGGVTLTSQDRLCMGGERLKVVSGSYWQTGAVYKPESQGGIRVTQKGTSGAPYFEVELSNGGLYRLDHSFQPAGGTAVTLRWSVTHAQDAFGNVMSFIYASSDEEDLLRYIRYGNAGDAEVEFRYQVRSDVRERFIAGRRVILRQALSEIVTRFNGDRVGMYRLVYGSQPYDPATSALTLKGIQKCGYEAGSTLCQSSIAMENSSSPVSISETGQGFSGIQSALKSAVLDWNGDGIDDFVTTDGSSIILRQMTSSGNAATSTLVGPLAQGKVFSLGAMDANSNGKSGIVYLQASVQNNVWSGTWYYLAQGASSVQVSSFSTEINADLAGVAHEQRAPEPVIADVDGDGTQDVILLNGSSWRILKGGGFSQLATISTTRLAVNKRPFPARLTNDGLVSLVFRNSSAEMGYLRLNRNGSPALWGALSGIPGDRVVPLDVNGDGLTDFVSDSNNQVRLHIANGSNGFISRNTGISSGQVFFPASDIEELDRTRYFIRAADLNGDAYQDLIYYNPVSLGQTFKYLISDGAMLAGPYDTNVTSNLRPRIGSFEYLYNIENDSSDYDITSGAHSYNTLHSVPDSPAIFEGLYVDYQSQTLRGRYKNAVYDQYGNFADYAWEDLAPEGEVLDRADIFYIVDNYVQIWRSNEGTGPFPYNYPSSWPTHISTLSDVAEITDYCGFSQDGPCRTIRNLPVPILVTYFTTPVFSILEGYNFYASQTFEGNLFSQLNGNDFQLMDVNADGMADIVAVNADDDGWVVHYSTGSSPKLAALTDSLGAEQKFTYGGMSAPGLYQPGAGTPPSNARPLNGGMKLVSKVQRDSGLRDAQGAVIFVDEDYQYAGAYLDQRGRGMLGFEAVTVTMPQRDEVLTRKHKQTFPHIGMVTEETLHIDGGTTLVRRSTTLPGVESLHGGVVTQPVVITTTSESFDDDGSAVSASRTDKAWSVFQSQFVQLDSETTTVGSALNALNEVTGVVSSHAKAVVEYDHDPATWIMGFASSLTDTWTRGAQQKQASTLRTRYADTLLPATTTEFAGTTYQLHTSYIYHASGNVQSTTRTANVNGQPQSRTEAISGFVANRYPAKLINALNQSEAQDRQYDLAKGVLTRSTDVNGLHTSYRYDALGRLEETITPDDVISASTLHSCAPPACQNAGQNAVWYVSQTVTHPAVSEQGAPARYRYMDALGREVASESGLFDGDYAISTKSFSIRGLLAEESVPHEAGASPAVSSFVYDALGRMESANFASGDTSSYDYQSRAGGGLKTEVTTTSLDHLGAPVVRINGSETNALGEVVSTTEDVNGLAINSEYNYDPQGNHSYSQIDGQASLVTLMEYDLAGRMTQIDDPDTGVTDYVYNGFGELQTQTLQNGSSQTWQYDLAGRQTSRTDIANSLPTVRQWFYDLDGTNCDSATGKRIGALACVRSPDFAEDYQYDGLGRLSIQETDISVPGQATRSYAMTYGYDNFSRQNAMQWPNNYQASWHYTLDGYLSEIRDGNGRTLSEVMEQNAFGQITDRRLANGVITSLSQFDPDTGRLLSRSATSVAGTLQQDSYFWWTNGNLGERVQQTSGATTLTETFGYDSLERLTSAVSAGALSRSEAVNYNRIGNIHDKYGVSGTYTYSTNQPHAVTAANGVSYGYDAAGNMTSRGASTIVYNALNNVESISTSGTEVSRFRYGPSDQRFHQRNVAGGVVTDTFYVVPGVYEEEISAGTTEQRVYVGDMLLHRTINGTPQENYLLRDHLGSVAVIADDQGQVIERVMYDPWGKVRTAAGADNGTGPVNGSRGFTDHEHLQDLGLIHMNGRIYDPLIARFLSADPFVQAPSYSQSYNRYSYVWNNPLNTTDPSGYLGLQSDVWVYDCVPFCGGSGHAGVDAGMGWVLGGGGIAGTTFLPADHFSGAGAYNLAYALQQDVDSNNLRFNGLDSPAMMWASGGSPASLHMALGEANAPLTRLESSSLLLKAGAGFATGGTAFGWLGSGTLAANLTLLQLEILGLNQAMTEGGPFSPGGWGGVTKGAIGFAPGEAVSALTANRLQHGTRHLVTAGILPPWRGTSSPQLIKNALGPILERPSATFNHAVGGTAVKGFLGEVHGSRVAVMVYSEGPLAGQLATSVVPSPNQLIKWGVAP